MKEENKMYQIPEEWTIAPLKEKFVFTSKPRGLRFEEFKNIPFIPMDYLPINRLFVSKYNLKEPASISSGTYFEEGDLLLSKITPCFENGKQGIAKDIPGGFGIATTEVIPIKEMEGVSHLPFLAMYLLEKDSRNALAGKMEGATGRQRLAKSTLEEWLIPIPPLQEQKTIAAILSKIQSAIEIQEKIVSNLKELKAAMMAKLFREGLHGEPLKQTEIGEIPQSWEVVELQKVASIERGKFTHRPRNDPRFYGGKIPFIQTGDVTKSNGLIRTYTQTLNEEGLKISKLFSKGTIVLTIAANIGDTGILEFDCAFPDSLVGISSDVKINSVFLNYYLMTQKKDMDRLAPKGTQKNINIQFLRPWPIVIPSMEEQIDIANILRLLDQKMETAFSKFDSLKFLFSSMLHQFMTGRVRINKLKTQQNSAVLHKNEDSLN